MTFGKILHKLRTENHISAPQLARKMGVSTQSIYLWEWEKAEPRLSFLIWLADAFKVSLDYLCGRDGSDKK